MANKPPVYGQAAGDLVKIAAGKKYVVDSIVVPAGATFSHKSSTTTYLAIDNSTGTQPVQIWGPFVFTNMKEETVLNCDAAGLILFGVENVH